MRWLLGPYAELRTYRVLLYLVLGLPLGVIEFTVLVTGFSLGLGLVITIIGIPVLVGSLLLARGLATVERGLAQSLLDAPMPWRGRTPEPRGNLFWSRLKDLFTSGRTWREVCFLLLRLPLGTLDFTIAVTTVSLALGWFAVTIVVAAGGYSEIGSWRLDTVLESLVFLPVSALFLLVGPRLLLAWGEVQRRFATWLLGDLSPRELKLAVAEVLATGESDGFRILADLELRLGRGPFLYPTRLEAALLSLESTGVVRSRRAGDRVLYSLAPERQGDSRMSS